MTLGQAEDYAQEASVFMAELQVFPEEGLLHDQAITRKFLMTWPRGPDQLREGLPLRLPGDAL
jgi:hypothetical protein